MHDLFAILFHLANGLSRVHDKFGLARDGVIVIARVIGGDQEVIVACGKFLQVAPYKQPPYSFRSFTWAQ
jgi:hypothetical protein